MAKKKIAAEQSPPAEHSAAGDCEPRPDFEETLAEIESIVRKLEGGELSLDESLACYETAVGRMRQCYQLLEVAERRICVLAGFDADGNPVTGPLEDAADGRGNDTQSLLDKQKTRGQRRGLTAAGSDTRRNIDHQDDIDIQDDNEDDIDNEEWT